jgi:Zn-dependent peptidase ImmA (M78 family)
MPELNPKILVWARETAGFSLIEAAHKLDINTTRSKTGELRLLEIESGVSQPTRSQLVRMAKLYRRPLLTFYMLAPPVAGERGQDFRTLPAEYSNSQKALVDALIRDVRARQEIASYLVRVEEDVRPIAFVGSMTTRSGHKEVLESIKTNLNIDLLQFRSNSNMSSNPTGFKYLRRQAEKAGIFVSLVGNLGSHTTTFDLETFRGIALADKFAPFIVINDQDSEKAWSFTLLHELCHIWLGQTGISSQKATSALEVFCNAVAAEFLIPEIEAPEFSRLKGLNFQELQTQIIRVAEAKNVSSSMVAYRLFSLGVIDQGSWSKLSALFRSAWLSKKQSLKEANKERDSGPNYYVVKRHKIGDGLVSLARRNLAEGNISPIKASSMLGVKPTSVYSLVNPASSLSSGKAA